MSMRILLRKVRSVKILVKIAKGYLITVVVFFIIYALVYALTAKEYYNIVQG